MGEVPMLRTSERAAFKRCQWRWFYQYRMGLVPSLIPRGPLWFGTGIHLALAEYYVPGDERGRDPVEVWEEYVDASEKILVKVTNATNEAKAEYFEALPLGKAMLEGHNKEYKGDPNWEIIAPEQTFAILIRDPRNPKKAIVQYVGTFDGVYRNKNTGKVWLLEHKTAKVIMLTHLALDDQPGSYILAANTVLRAMGLLKKDEHIEGVMYNILRKGMPDDRPRDTEGRYLNKDGKVSKVQPAPLFKRYPVKRTVAQTNRVLERIQTEAVQMEMFRDGTVSVTKNPTRDCSWDCPFFEMCKLDEAGADLNDFIAANMKVEDPYMDHRVGAKNTKESLALTRELKLNG